MIKIYYERTEIYYWTGPLVHSFFVFLFTTVLSIQVLLFIIAIFGPASSEVSLPPGSLFYQTNPLFFSLGHCLHYLKFATLIIC